MKIRKTPRGKQVPRERRSFIGQPFVALARSWRTDDPGDAFLIAAARARRLALVTRDAKILELSQTQPDYLKVIPC